MARKTGIGHQDFEKLRLAGNFYIDKTSFIKEWWDGGDIVTLITRPRRFGKTLNMSMVEQFFSCSYAERGGLFEGLSVWEDREYRELQGTYPVIFLSFADVKDTGFSVARKKICKIIQLLYNKFDFLLESGVLSENEREDFLSISADMEDYMASLSLKMLSDYLYRYYGKKTLILLDEYDTPMQEAYVGGYWEEMSEFIRSLFNSTFKTNPYLERAIMTGITRISTPQASLGKESIFSDLNNLEVVTTTSNKYEEAFGFTESEVFAALDEYGMSEKKQEVKAWYDGFSFGASDDIYNPWSIINYLDKRKVEPYWVNTSSNSLAGKLIREGGQEIQQQFEQLLSGGMITTEMDEQIVYSQLDQGEPAVWGLLLASGYLRVRHYEVLTDDYGGWKQQYTLELTNFEVKAMFRKLISGWFGQVAAEYNGFIKACCRMTGRR